MKDSNDVKSVRMWVLENPDLVSYYQEFGLKVPGSLSAENMPFVIGIQTPYQYEQMLKHGHLSAVAIDATFGTNDKKVRTLRLCSLNRTQLRCSATYVSLSHSLTPTCHVVPCSFPSIP